MGAVAEALSKGRNVNQKELLKQVPGMSKTALNSMVERMKKRLRSARRAHEAKLSKTAAVQDFVQGTDTDHAASLLLQVANSLPPNTASDSQPGHSTQAQTTDIEDVRIQIRSDPDSDERTVCDDELVVLQDELKRLELGRSALDAENINLKDEITRLKEEITRLKIEMQTIVHSLTETTERMRNMEIQLRKEQDSVKTHQDEFTKQRQEQESHTPPTSQSTRTDTQAHEQIALEQQLRDALRENAVLQAQALETTRSLDENNQERSRLLQELDVMAKTRDSLQTANQQLEQKIRFKGELMKKLSSNLKLEIDREKEKQAAALSEEFQRTLDAHTKERDRLHEVAMRRMKIEGADAMRELRTKLVDIDAEMRDAKNVAELRDALTGVDEGLVALMRQVAKVENHDVLASFTMQKIEIAGHLCGSQDFEKDLSAWRERRNIFCYQRHAMKKLKDLTDTIPLCYQICDTLRALSAKDSSSVPTDGTQSVTRALKAKKIDTGGRPLFTARDATKRGVDGGPDPIVEWSESLIEKGGIGVFAVAELEPDDVVTAMAGHIEYEEPTNPEYAVELPGRGKRKYLVH